LRRHREGDFQVANRGFVEPREEVGVGLADGEQDLAHRPLDARPVYGTLFGIPLAFDVYIHPQ
jgi:hypothetical protein